jgi:hypothetical protein
MVLRRAKLPRFGYVSLPPASPTHKPRKLSLGSNIANSPLATKLQRQPWGTNHAGRLGISLPQRLLNLTHNLKKQGSLAVRNSWIRQATPANSVQPPC